MSRAVSGTMTPPTADGKAVPMSDEAGLLLAIRERPADDFPRRVYADWLDDQGQAERAELVRLQLDLAAGDESGREREQQLLAAHGQRWLDDVLTGFTLRPTQEWMRREECGPGRFAAFRRGLVGVLFLPAEEFTRSGKEFAARLAAVSRVQLTDRWPDPPPYPWANYFVWRRGTGLPVAVCDRLLLAWGQSRAELRSELSPGLPEVSRACVLFLAGLGVGEVNRRAEFSVGEVSRLCRVTLDEVERWTDGGGLPAGAAWRGRSGVFVRREALIAFMRARGIPFDRRWGDGDLEGITLRQID